MTVKSGFFNSYNNDRIYDADDFAGFLDGIVYDGVYQSVGQNFKVIPKSGMKIAVGTGRAWFDHTWTVNDQELALTLDPADTVYTRIDAVVLEVNKTKRENSIKIVKGTPASNPSRPALPKDDDFVNQYALAYIEIGKNVTSITAAKITNVVGSPDEPGKETPFCSALALSGLPSGGTVGQVLAKIDSENGSVGWFNYDHLPVADWMHTQGISDSDIVAAFKFKGAYSEALALESVHNGTKYTLEKAVATQHASAPPTWSAEGGFFMPRYVEWTEVGSGLDSQTLKNKADQIKTVSVKYNNVEPGSNVIPGVFFNNDYVLFIKLGGVWEVADSPNDEVRYFKKIGCKYQNKVYYSNTISENTSSGVIGITLDGNTPHIYHNGVECALTLDDDPRAFDFHVQNCRLFGGLAGSFYDRKTDCTPLYGSYNIHAAIFLNRKLTSAEMLSLHEAMATI